MAKSATRSEMAPATLHTRLDFGSATDKARREKNEDFVGYKLIPTGLAAMLADGMGGGVDGEMFSKLAVEEALSAFRKSDHSLSSRDKLIRAFMSAVRSVHELKMSDNRYKKSGTTLIGALIEESEGEAHLSIGNIGDSRAYLVDAQGNVERLSRDHTRYEDLVQQGKSPEEARADPQVARLTQVLGNDIRVPQDVPGFLVSRPLKSGDIVVLCTDGIHKKLSGKEIGRAVTNRSAQEAADSLVRQALEREAQDNVTTFVARLKPPRTQKQSNMVAMAGGGIAAFLLLVALVWMISSSFAADNGSTQSTQSPSPANMNGEKTVTPIPPTDTNTATATLTPVPTEEPDSTIAPTNTATPTPTDTPTVTPTPIPPTPIPPTPRPATVPPAQPTEPPAQPTEPPAQPTIQGSGPS